MRAKAANTQRLWRGIPSWQRSVLALVAMVVALVQLAGSSAAPGDPPNVNGEWSAPFAWPIVAVHMSLTSTGEVISLDGFGAALNSERLWNPQTGLFTPVPYGRNLFCGGHVQLPDGRTLFVGGHIAAYEGLADTTLFNANTDTYFRGADMAEPRWYPTATQMPDGKVLRLRRRPDRPEPPRGSPRLRGRVGQLAAGALQPGHEHVDEPDERAADDAALPPAVRPLGREGDRRRPGYDDAHPDTGVLDVVDVDDEPVRRTQRRHVPAEQDHEVRHMGRPRLRRAARLRHERPHRGARHERPEPDLARNVADGARARIPQHDPAARRDGARERRQLALGRARPDEVGSPRRDLESGHRNVDGGRLAPERPPVPLDGAAAAGRPRADGRRRRGRRRH